MPLQLVEEFPDLEKYVGCWPVNDLMKMRLKAKAAKVRRQVNAQAVDLLSGKVRLFISASIFTKR
jgi:hypothetical protein